MFPASTPIPTMRVQLSILRVPRPRWADTCVGAKVELPTQGHRQRFNVPESCSLPDRSRKTESRETDSRSLLYSRLEHIAHLTKMRSSAITPVSRRHVSNATWLHNARLVRSPRPRRAITSRRCGGMFRFVRAPAVAGSLVEKPWHRVAGSNVIPGGTANDSVLRSHQYDKQGAGSVGE
jgi:hypothetical protein